MVNRNSSNLHSNNNNNHTNNNNNNHHHHQHGAGAVVGGAGEAAVAAVAASNRRGGGAAAGGALGPAGDWVNEDIDRFSFEDSDRFEEDSLCSWSSDPESLYNNWRGWKKPSTFGLVNTSNNGSGCGDTNNNHSKVTEVLTLTELAAKCVASFIPFELVEHVYPPVPEQLQLRIAFWSFPDNEEDIRLYSCLANSSSDEFNRGDQIFKSGAVKDPLQIGFHLSATVVCLTHSQNFNVAVTFDRRRVSSCNCTCDSSAYWCSHVVAVCLHRIHCPLEVCLRAPVSESLTRLQRDQLQKFAQYLISELPQQILPTAQRLLDELLSEQPTAINTVCGAPDPTAGASINDQTNWYLDEKTLHDNIKRILIKFVMPAPIVFSDVNYLTNSAPPAATEWSSLLRPLRGREPEGMWNLLSIVREMYRRCDRNAIRLLEIITEQCMACDQLLLWWYQTKLSLMMGSHGHNGGKHSNTHSNSKAIEHACSSLFDEIVALWRLAALNPGLAPDERDMLHAQFTSWHLKILDRVVKCRIIQSTYNNKHQQNTRSDAEMFIGFKPAIEACYLDWEEYPISGVTHTHDTNPIYYSPFACFKHTESKTEPSGGQLNATQALMANNKHYNYISTSTDLSGHSAIKRLERPFRERFYISSSNNSSNSSSDSVHARLHSGLNTSTASATSSAVALVSVPSATLNNNININNNGENNSCNVSLTDSTGTEDNKNNNGNIKGKSAEKPTSIATNATGAGSEVINNISENSSNLSTNVITNNGAQPKGSNVLLVTAPNVNNLGSADRAPSEDGNRSSTSSEGFCENEDFGADSISNNNICPNLLTCSKDNDILHKSSHSMTTLSESDSQQSFEISLADGLEDPEKIELGFAMTPAIVIDEIISDRDDMLAMSISAVQCTTAFSEGSSISNTSPSTSSNSPSSSSNSSSSSLLAASVAEVLEVSSANSNQNKFSVSEPCENNNLSSSSDEFVVTQLTCEKTVEEQSKSDKAISIEKFSSDSVIRPTEPIVSKDNSNENTTISALSTLASTENVKTSLSSLGPNCSKFNGNSLISNTKAAEAAAILDGPSTSIQAIAAAAVIATTSASASGSTSALPTIGGNCASNNSSSKPPYIFSNVRPTEDAWDILLARAEGLHAHGHGREACILAVRLAEEMLTKPPNLMVEMPPMPKRKGKNRNINPISHHLTVLASNTLSKCAFLCTVLSENCEHHHIGFRICIYALEMPRPPASTKPLEVKLANQEADILALLKKIPINEPELEVIRDRAERLRNGGLKSRGEALLPINLASYIFDALVLPQVSIKDQRLRNLNNYRPNKDDNLGFEAAVAALGLKANVSEAEHPLLCEGTRRQRGELALTLLYFYKDDPHKIAKIMEKLLDREIHVLLRTPLLPAFYSTNPPVRTPANSTHRITDNDHHNNRLGLNCDNNGITNTTASSLVCAGPLPGPTVAVGNNHICNNGNMELFCNDYSSSVVGGNTNSRPTSSTSAEIEASTPGTLHVSSSTSNNNSNLLNASSNTSQSLVGNVPSLSTATTVNTSRQKDCRYKGKRAYPSIPNQPSEASAHFMFELAKNVLIKAGGNSSTSLFTQATTNHNHHGPHRGLHMCAFQLGLYALGLHNCVSPNWLSRTYSSHVSWIIGQATEIGAPAISFLIDTWEGHLTPPEAASMADRASRGWDSNYPAAELALSVLPHAAALNPNEIQRAILQCKEQSDYMLERACITVENAAKGGGVYPEVLFQVAHYWYELYIRNTPNNGEHEQYDEQMDHSATASLSALIESHQHHEMQLQAQQVSANNIVAPGGIMGVSGGNIAGPPTMMGPGPTPTEGCTAGQVVVTTATQAFQQSVSALAAIGMSPYTPYGFCQSMYYHNLAYPPNQMSMCLSPMPPSPMPSYPGYPTAAPPPPQQQHPSVPNASGVNQQTFVSHQPNAGVTFSSLQAATTYGAASMACALATPPSTFSTATNGALGHSGIQMTGAMYYGQSAVPGSGPIHSQQQQQQSPPSLPPQHHSVNNAQQAVMSAAQHQLRQMPAPPPHAINQSQAMYSFLAAQQHLPNQQQLQMPVQGAGQVSVSGQGQGPGPGLGPGLGQLPGQAPANGQGSGPGRQRHPAHQFTPTQLRYLLAAYNVGMLALKTLARRVHDDRPQAKYARTPPYGEDVKWLLRISKKLGSQYLHQFCVCAVNSVVSPFVLHDVAIESAHYLGRNNHQLVMQHLRSALTPLVQKCKQMYIQCIHQKLYHLTPADYEDFASITVAARSAFQITPEGSAQFKDLLQSIKRSKSCKKELWAQINAALQSNAK